MPAPAVAAPRVILSRDPATGEVLRELPCATPEDVLGAVSRAASAQPGWSARPLAERLACLRRFRDRLYEGKDEVAALISRETGKPFVEALVAEVVVALDAAGYCLREVPGFLRPRRVRHANPAVKAKRAVLLRRPYGVVGVISPWNYPLSIPATEVMTALAIGNAVVLKPSEITPQVALKLHELMLAAGVPADLFQVVVGDGEAGAALLRAPIQKLFFTGSVATGKKIAAEAAARLLPVVLELGGKDPMLVLDDADLETASSAAVWGAFMNAGQTCLSVERCYVHRSLYERFVARCVAKTAKLHVGPATDPEAEVGPLITPQQLRMVEEQVEEARALGARILTGGMRLPALGPQFYAPTVIVDVPARARLMQEETFGPVLPIAPFDSDEEAVALAEGSEFGLAASLWTGDRVRGERLALRLHAGAVLINDVISSFGIPEAPHGGVRSSGIGRTHGQAGLEEMTWMQYVDADLLPRMPKAWWYGYGPDVADRMRGFADLLFSPSLLARLRGGWKAGGLPFRRNKV
jgi:acyl-CoA reductase-like NAD-dependent aldehyde dehydrogenase